MTQLLNYWQTSSNINIDYANYEASVNLTADFAWTGTHTYSNTITFNGDVTFNSTSTSGGVTVTNSSGASAFILDISTGGYNSLLTQIAITTVPGDGGSAGIQFIDGKDSTSFTYNNAIYTVDGAGTYFSDANAGDFLIVAGYAPGTTSGQTVRIGAVKSTASPSSLAISNTALTCTVPGTWTAEQTFNNYLIVGASQTSENNSKLQIFSSNNAYGQIQIGNATANDEASMSFSNGVTGFTTGQPSISSTGAIWDIGISNWGNGTYFGIGNNIANGKVWTFETNGALTGVRNTLDDGSGNMSIAGNYAGGSYYNPTNFAGGFNITKSFGGASVGSANTVTNDLGRDIMVIGFFDNANAAPSFTSDTWNIIQGANFITLLPNGASFTTGTGNAYFIWIGT